MSFRSLLHNLAGFFFTEDPCFTNLLSVPLRNNNHGFEILISIFYIILLLILKLARFIYQFDVLILRNHVFRPLLM